MNKPMTLACAFLLFGSLVSAETPEGTASVKVRPNQAVIQVNGIVCSFCAYGTEKNLRRLTFLDKSQFGDDGVLIDIHRHRITLSLQPAELVDLSSAIKKGGYDPVSDIEGMTTSDYACGDDFDDYSALSSLSHLHDLRTPDNLNPPLGAAQLPIRFYLTAAATDETKFFKIRR